MKTDNRSSKWRYLLVKTADRSKAALTSWRNSARCNLRARPRPAQRSCPSPQSDTHCDPRRPRYLRSGGRTPGLWPITAFAALLDELVVAERSPDRGRDFLTNHQGRHAEEFLRPSRT